MIVLPGIEPGSRGSKPRMIDHYTTGLKKNKIKKKRTLLTKALIIQIISIRNVIQVSFSIYFHLHFKDFSSQALFPVLFVDDSLLVSEVYFLYEFLKIKHPYPFLLFFCNYHQSRLSSRSICEKTSLGFISSILKMPCISISINLFSKRIKSPYIFCFNIHFI